MSSDGRISTPWSHYWQRFRHRMLPVLSFAVCVALTMWLWDRQGRFPNLVGEVEAVRVDVAARSDGVLAPLPTPLSRFDMVRANQVIARLDDRLIQTQLGTMQRELERLGLELKATTEKTALSESDRQHTYLQEVTRLQSEVEQRRLDVLSRKIAIEVDVLARQRLNVEIEALEKSHEQKVVPDLQLKMATMQRDELTKRIDENGAAWKVAEAQQGEAEGRLKQFPGLEKAKVEDLVAPIEAAITVQKSRIRELQIQIEALEIRSPIAGMVYEILRWPGQNVRAGDPVVTVADNTGGYIVSYVRQDQRLRPAEGMTVAVRPRLPGSHTVQATIQGVGAQVVPVPAHHLRDPKFPEWGLPVRIPIPDGLGVRPGELLDVTLESGSKSGSG